MTGEDLRLTPGARVLVADRSEPHAQQVSDHLTGVGHTVYSATDGEEALRLIRGNDLELALLDVAIPRVNAFQLCERLKAHPSTRSVPVVMLVEPNALDARLRGLEVGAEDFLHRPVNKLELLARVKTLVRVKRLNEQVESTENVIYGLAHLIEEKETGGQNGFGRLADLACALGRELDLGEEDLETLRKGAVLHDIGKIGVRESVLLKQGELSPEEFDEIKLHPEVGERICAPLRCADQVLPLIRHHRERWDGKGYPDGLQGTEIPFLARILAIADAYDAMLSPRPYRAPLTPDETREALSAGAGIRWDPELVELFLRCSAEGLTSAAA